MAEASLTSLRHTKVIKVKLILKTTAVQLLSLDAHLIHVNNFLGFKDYFWFVFIKMICFAFLLFVSKALRRE